MKTKFPDWFSHWMKPPTPTKPKKHINSYEEVARIEIGNHLREDLPEEAKLADGIYVDMIDSYGDCSVILTFFKNKEIENPCYKENIITYNQKMKEYRNRKIEWEKYKKLYDEEIKEERKQMYKKLKKEFEGE